MTDQDNQLPPAEQPPNCFDCPMLYKDLPYKEFITICFDCLDRHPVIITEPETEGDFDSLADDAHDEFLMQENLRRGG